MDTASQLIMAMDVLPGNAQDYEHALKLVKESVVNTGSEVGDVVGD